MPAPTRRSRLLYLLLIVPVMLAAEDRKGCKCKRDVDDEAGNDRVVQDVDVRLQVVSIDPSTVDAGAAFPAHVYGSAFEEGATVKIGNLELGKGDRLDENTLRVQVPALAKGTYDVTVTNPNGENARLRQGLTVRDALGDCRDLTVLFDFDSSTLTADARAAIDAKMSCFTGTTGDVDIEGHCDERGTTEYNLALGARRAETVKRYLTNQGITASRLRTTSYGEERPVARGYDESAWAQNRRVEIHVAE